MSWHGIVCFVVVIFVEDLSALESENINLIEQIFADYEHSIFPMTGKPDTAVRVGIHAAIYNIDDVDEPMEQVTATFWMRMHWIDERLRWDMGYGNASEIIVPLSFVWQPDIIVYNAYMYVFPPPEKNYIHVQSNGLVKAKISLTVTARMNFKINRYPFDDQSFLFSFGSWELTNNYINIYCAEDNGLMKYYQKDSSWNLYNYTCTDTFTNVTSGSYSQALVELNLHRYSSFMVATQMIPLFTLSMLTIVGLFSPFCAYNIREQKVEMGLTAMLTVAFAMSSVSEHMPKSTSGLPFLGEYFLFEMILLTTATLCATLVMYEHHRAQVDHNPSWVVRMLSIKPPPPPENDRIKYPNDNDGKTDQDSPMSKASARMERIVWQLRDSLTADHQTGLEEMMYGAACDRLDNFVMVIFLCCDVIISVGMVMSVQE